MPRVTAYGLDIVWRIQQLEDDDPRRSSAVFVVHGMGATGLPRNCSDTTQTGLLVLIGRLPAFVLFALLLACASTSEENELEQSVCGLKEPVFFMGWSRAAGTPDSSRLSGLENIEEVSVKSKDRRILRGYKLKGLTSENTGVAKGYLLVVQGNAMLADQIIGQFQQFAESGYDVYIFDYRGYGRSEGKPRFKAILSDYSEIIDFLNSRAYQNRVFYGLSFGGVVLLDALKNKTGKKRVVIDSARSQFSEYGCPEVHDPLNNLPEDSSNFLVIVGLKDRVVTPHSSAKLLELAKRRGASILKHPELDHPFMDKDISLHNYRMSTVRSFLLADK